MTRVFLAAGVAALAIAAPASADKGDRGGNKGGQAAAAQQGGGGGQQRAERPQRMERQSMQRVERPQRMERQAQRQSMPRFERQQQRVERQAQPRFERRQERAQVQRAERQQRFAAFRQDRAQNDRKAERRVERGNRIDRQQVRAERQQRFANRVDRQQVREQRFDRQEQRNQRFANRVDREQLRGQRVAGQFERGDFRDGRIELRNDRIRVANAKSVMGFGAGGCPPGLVSKGCVPPGQSYNANRFIGDADAYRYSRLASLAYSPRYDIIEPYRAASFLGSPLSSLAGAYSLMAMPQAVSYLYPDTDDYYYRYGNGYAYRVDRDNDLISYILPLLAGGYMPGQYLPSSYMNSYVPDYYGFNSFYPSSYGSEYGYGYDNLCNRYVNGVVYQVDCSSGIVEDVIPLYAGGYGVGQYLPASYGTYNVPYQYRDMYYNTSDQNYWYAPGAIYQVDPSSQLITAVASLLAPGFSVGQPLPAGYGMYNVPLGYRDTYYDTSSAWYRYNNGNIYQVDPTTQLVTAIVASVLT